MLEIISKKSQAYGEFNNGEIIENKPIGFPKDGGKLKAYSNLFYWAYAKANFDSTIGLHPHKGFEIITYVINKKMDIVKKRRRTNYSSWFWNISL